MWWWKEKVSKGISEKIRLWKLWKAGGSKDKDLDAKWKVQHVVYRAKRNAEIVLKAIKKTSFALPEKCAQKTRM